MYVYIYICGIHAYFFGGHDIWGILDIRIFHRIHWIHHPNDIYITVIVKQMMVEFMKSIWKIQDTRLELWNAHEHINKDTDK